MALLSVPKKWYEILLAYSDIICCIAICIEPALLIKWWAPEEKGLRFTTNILFTYSGKEPVSPGSSASEVEGESSDSSGAGDNIHVAVR